MGWASRGWGGGRTRWAFCTCPLSAAALVPARLQVPCDSTEWEMNHLYPAFAQPGQECLLQKEPLLFSCAGASAKYQRLCPCRDFRKGQVALCRDCL